MPYKMIKLRDKNLYKVINSVTGEVHAKGTTRRKAEAQIRLLNQFMEGT
jgi:hypothetical protein